MQVCTSQPFKIIYSLYDHECLGFLFESFAVELDVQNKPTLRHQNISGKNIQEFAERLNKTDFELVDLIDAIQQEAILKKFNTKKLSPVDFFLKVYDAEKGDNHLQERIQQYLEHYRTEILKRVPNSTFFVMGKDGNPTWQEVEVMKNPARIFFHFERTEIDTHYFPIIRYDDKRLKFQFQNAKILCEANAYLLLENKLYHFDRPVDGRKLKPFLAKSHIVIHRNIEETYYKKFIAPLVAQFDVFAKGFAIETTNCNFKFVLSISKAVEEAIPVLLNDEDRPPSFYEKQEEQMLLELLLDYEGHIFKFDSSLFLAYVNVEYNEKKGWTFYKIKRKTFEERRKISSLKERGIDFKSASITLPKNELFSWLHKNMTWLQENQFEIEQKQNGEKQYFLGRSSIEISIEEKPDWFDVKALVRFGEYTIPFSEIRKLILQRKIEFMLPNGEIAIIPNEWLLKYGELFLFSKEHESDYILNKQHLMLVRELKDGGVIKSQLSRKIENLQKFERIEEYPISTTFLGNLRPYQKAAYDWMHFLREYNFGGCLADDMGLGKTVITLAFLQSLKNTKTASTSLLVLPTSLLYNWQREAERFTSDLRIYVHIGTYREKNADIFQHYDLVIMSYAILRLDINFIKDYGFNYVVLDESQAIKNPNSNITQAVFQLNAKNKLILTGTPLENSTLDLWTQMSFINPGLLGDQNYFRKSFLNPIERNQDIAQTAKLYRIIKPFMLRRQKSQVASELPAKIEMVQYCDMGEEQEQIYEQTKSYYRNLILKQMEGKGNKKIQIDILKGLSELRQLANHPNMILEEFEGRVGKFEDVRHKLKTVLENNSKALIFSQFVKHLNIFRAYLDSLNVEYCYLDGSTINRHEEVERFQDTSGPKLFLISLKAGGVGLNLTAAEYVFLLDPWWNPAIEAQAVDRAHRIGQTNTVFIYKFITRNSVEEKILLLQQSKQKLFSELIGSEDTFMKSLDKENLLMLLS